MPKENEEIEGEIMYLTEYLKMRGVNANALTHAEAELLNIDITAKGWVALNAHVVVPEELANAVRNGAKKAELRALAGSMLNHTLPMDAPAPVKQIINPGHTHEAYGRWETRFSAKKGRDEWHFVDMTEESGRVYLYADSIPEVKTVNGRGALPGWHRRPAIFMPRKAVGIMLEVGTVRVERLQDISEADAMAEGIYWYPVHQGNGFCDGFSHLPNDVGCVFHKTAADAYRALWESINGAGSWDANPWVWVYEFKKIEEQKHEN